MHPTVLLGPSSQHKENIRKSDWELNSEVGLETPMGRKQVTTKAAVALISITAGSPASAGVPIAIDAGSDYEIELIVESSGRVICELESARGRDENARAFNTTDCSVNLAGLSDLTLKGHYRGSDVLNRNQISGKFEITYTLFDVSQWTAVLRDQALDFGTRLDRYHENLVTLNPNLRGRFTIERFDVSASEVVQKIEDELVVKLPPEFAAFTNRNINVTTYLYEGGYVGPATEMSMAKFRKRSEKPVLWPSITDREREADVPGDYLPAEGSDLRKWYDRTLVVYEQLRDGIGLVVWDPDAKSGDPSFFWLSEDDRESSPYLTRDGVPASAQEVLLTLLDWDSDIERADEDFYDGWVRSAIVASGLDADEPNLRVVDSNNPNAVLSISFTQGRNIPFLKTVEPNFAFSNGTAWWNR